MRWLITGGAGFIGSHLARYLLKLGHKVEILDDYSTGSLANVPEGASVRYGDVRDPKDVAPLMSICDGVFHLAAAVGVKRVMETPEDSLSVNIEGTQCVLDYARSREIDVLFVSTSEVYGLSRRFPLKEEDPLEIGPPTVTRWGYAVSKLAGEFLARAAHSYEMRVPIVRLFNTVGPGQSGNYGMVLPRFVRAALRGQPLLVYGDGDQTRCFCHVEDVVTALHTTLSSFASQALPINIGGTEEISIRDLAQRVITLAESKSEIAYADYQSIYPEGFADTRRRVPDISRSKELGVWEGPTKDLNQIIDDVIVYERTRL